MDRTPKPLRVLPGPEDLLRFLTFVAPGTLPPKHTRVETPCWQWVGATQDKGYGRFRYDGRVELAHRFSYQGLRQRKCRPGMHVDHRCLNTGCVNPTHIREQTCTVNTGNGNRTRHLPKKPDDDCPI